MSPATRSTAPTPPRASASAAACRPPSPSASPASPCRRTATAPPPTAPDRAARDRGPTRVGRAGTPRTRRSRHECTSVGGRGSFDRLRPAVGAPRRAVAPRPAVVHGQRPDRDARGRRRRRDRGRQPVLVARRDPHRRADGDVLHGVPLGAGPAARPAADDPVAPAVRLRRRAARVAVRLPAVRRLQRLQHDPRGPGGEHDDRARREARHRHRDRPRRRRRADRLRLHPPRRARPDVHVPRDLRRVHDRRDRHARAAGRRDGPRQLRRRPVPDAVRRHGRLPDQLGDLRLGLLALPAARRHRPPDVLVDLLGLGPRGGLAHGARRAARVVRRQGVRHRRVDREGGERHLRRLRDDRPALLGARAHLGDGAEPLRRLADRHQRGRLVPQRPPDARRAGRDDLVHGGAVAGGRAHLERVVPDELRGLPAPDPLPVHPVDGGEPHRLLRRAPRPLRGRGDLQAARHLRPVGVARDRRVHDRLRLHGPVLLDARVHRADRQGDGRRRPVAVRRPAGRGRPVPAVRALDRRGGRAAAGRARGRRARGDGERARAADRTGVTDGFGSAVERVQAALDAIERLDPQLNAFTVVLRDEALETARAVDRGDLGGPLAGVPVAIKDHVWMRGAPATNGSLALAGFVPDVDCACVARLRDAGAVLIGKTNNPEFCYRGITDNALYGLTRNPWDVERTPGGSSGGSGAAVAAGMVPMALGTDGGGSIRIPASFCGIAGLKPSFGVVPKMPGFRGWPTLSVDGPLARTVRDLALMLAVMAGPTPLDESALDVALGDVLGAVERGDVAGLRIGASVDLGFAPVERDVREVFGRALDALGDAGWAIEEVTPPSEPPIAMWNAIACAEGYASEGPLLDAHAAQMSFDTAEIVRAGERITAAEYLDVQDRRAAYAGEWAELFEGIDLLLTPAMQLTAFPVGILSPEAIDGAPVDPFFDDWVTFCLPANLTGRPAASVPIGFGDGGLPVGMQILGRRFEDAVVLGAAAAVERALPWADTWPPVSVGPAGPRAR